MAGSQNAPVAALLKEQRRRDCARRHWGSYRGRVRHRQRFPASPKGRQPIPGAPWKFNLISTLRACSGAPPGLSGRAESVDGAGRALYKTGNGGGRNPAADVL